MNTWRITWMTQDAANELTRRTMSIGPELGLGWTPYTILVTYGSVNQWACHTEEQLASWLTRKHLRVVDRSDMQNGLAHGRLEPF